MTPPPDAPRPDEEAFYATLDPGIRRFVQILRENGVETYESCQGGAGHNGGAGEWPVVRFHGPAAEGFRALSVAMTYALPVYGLHRVWRVEDGEPTGPRWELVFFPVEKGVTDD